MKVGRRSMREKEQTPGSGGQQEVGLTEDGVDLVRVQGAALRLEGWPTAPPTPQVTVHQGVHIKHAHQQRPGHGCGRLRLIGCLPRADITEDPRTWIHLHLAHLKTSTAGSAPPPCTGKVFRLSAGEVLTCPLAAVHWLSEQLLLSSSMLVWLHSGASSPM